MSQKKKELVFKWLVIYTFEHICVAQLQEEYGVDDDDNDDDDCDCDIDCCKEVGSHREQQKEMNLWKPSTQLSSVWTTKQNDDDNGDISDDDNNGEDHDDGGYPVTYGLSQDMWQQQQTSSQDGEQNMVFVVYEVNIKLFAGLKPNTRLAAFLLS